MVGLDAIRTRMKCLAWVRASLLLVGSMNDTFSQQYRSIKVTFDMFKTRSKAMEKCIEKAKRVAASDATILLLGETGTGKNFLAQAIHNASPRHAGPFAILNCTGVPETLIESELFGHRKGAFTGATHDRAGVFALGHKGTVFIDEIGELPLVAQAKILQVVEYKQFKRVGSEKTEHADVRLICATNRRIDQVTSRSDRFREDLFYRLYEVPIEVPALRERREDIPMMIDLFLEEANRKYKKNVRGLTPAVEEFFRTYSWPGNVRELRGVIRGGVAQTNDDTIGFEDIPCKMIPGVTAVELEEMDLTLRAAERRHILMVLEMLGWNKTRAAEALGINRGTLFDKIAALGILPPTSAPDGASDVRPPEPLKGRPRKTAGITQELPKHGAP